jgi:hypothetical protein
VIAFVLQVAAGFGKPGTKHVCMRIMKSRHQHALLQIRNVGPVVDESRGGRR